MSFDVVFVIVVMFVLMCVVVCISLFQYGVLLFCFFAVSVVCSLLGVFCLLIYVLLLCCVVLLLLLFAFCVFGCLCCVCC